MPDWEPIICPQCGEDTDELVEGHCAECTLLNTEDLIRYNAEHDRWRGMSDRERDDQIQRAMG